MANYFYVAKSFEGNTKTGVLEVADESHLAQQLKDEGLILISAVMQGQKKKGLMNISLPSHVSLTEKIIMSRQLGVMFATGLSLVKSFDLLATQARNKTLKLALGDIKERINKGENLSDALAAYPKIFSELFVNMVKIGEESGTLEDIFAILSLQLGKEHELKSKIINALIYPSIIVMVMIVVGIVIVTFVLPSLTVFFTSLNVQLPFYTIALLAAAGFFSVHWYLLFLLPVVIGGVIFAILKTKKGKRALDMTLLKTPIISPIIKKSNSAFIVRSLSSLIAAGVSLIRSLEIVANSSGNYAFKQTMTEAQERIKKGDKLSKILRDHQEIFPLGVVEMVEVGEETGRTSDILKKLAEFYEQEAVASIEKLTILIEPILIIILGVGVGVFALSVIQPLYSSLKGIQ